MLKQNIEYTDFNGTKRNEDLYFNLTEIELVDIQVDSEVGIEEDLKKFIADKDLRKLLDFIKMLVHKAYGVKSEDGRTFEKNPEILNKFVSSALYSNLLLDLFEDEGRRATAFITGLMPKELIERAKANMAGEESLYDQYKPSAREQSARHTAQNHVPEPSYTEASPIKSPAFSDDPAAPEGPPANGAPVEEVAQPFRIKEVPLEIGETSVNDELAAYRAWKAEQDKNQQ